MLEEDIHVMPAYYFDVPKYHSLSEVVCVHNQLHSWEQMKEGRIDLEPSEKPRKKDLEYYLYVWVNRLLRSRGLQMRLHSI